LSTLLFINLLLLVTENLLEEFVLEGSAGPSLDDFLEGGSGKREEEDERWIAE
jgi:hypothetical protein